MADQKALMLNPSTIRGRLEMMKEQIEAALPRHITPERMARIALTALRLNPKLYRSTEESFFGAIIIASQLGLEPGVNGQCYLVPYKNKDGLYICTFIPGWRGYMDLLSRTGRAVAWTNAVYEGDEFDYEFGDKPFVHHKPGKRDDESDKALKFTYAIGRVKGMEESPVIEVWPAARIWDHRKRNNKVGDDHYSYTYPEMYARKIPLMQVIKYMPMSIELNVASALDISGTEGRQRLTIDGAFKAGKASKAGEAGEESEEWAQIEFLMEKLNWDADARANSRVNYATHPKDLLAYLRKKDGPLNFAASSQSESQSPAEQPSQQEIKSESSFTEPGESEEGETIAPQVSPQENLDAEPVEPEQQPPPAPEPRRRGGRPSNAELQRRRAEQQPQQPVSEESERQKVERLIEQNDKFDF